MVPNWHNNAIRPSAEYYSLYKDYVPQRMNLTILVSFHWLLYCCAWWWYEYKCCFECNSSIKQQIGFHTRCPWSTEEAVQKAECAMATENWRTQKRKLENTRSLRGNSVCTRVVFQAEHWLEYLSMRCCHRHNISAWGGNEETFPIWSLYSLAIKKHNLIHHDMKETLGQNY